MQGKFRSYQDQSTWQNSHRNVKTKDSHFLQYLTYHYWIPAGPGSVVHLP